MRPRRCHQVPPDTVKAGELSTCRKHDAPQTGGIVFKGRELDILLALWHWQGQDFPGAALAGIAEVSPAFARRVLTNIVELGWLVHDGAKTHRKYHVEHPEAVLEAFVTSLPQHRWPWQYFSVDDQCLEEFAHRFDNACRTRNIPYAVTGDYAANGYLGPAAAVETLQIRVACSSEAASLFLHLRVGPRCTKGNVAIIVSNRSTDWLMRSSVDDVVLAATPIVASDLLRTFSPMTPAFLRWLKRDLPRPSLPELILETD